MLGVMLLAGLLRFWALDRVPPGFHYDEAFEGLEAWKVLSQPGYHPIFFTGNFGVEPLFIFLTSVAFRVAGTGPMVQRAVAAVLGTLTVPAVYLLARELSLLDRTLPRSLALLSALSLAVMYFHVHFSRVGIEPVLVPLLFGCGFWALFRGLRMRRLGACVVAGVCLGLGPYAYPAGRLLLPVAVAFLLGGLLLESRWLRGRWPYWGVALVSAVLVMAPLAIHFARNPELLTLRTSQVVVGGGERGSLGSNTLRTLGMFSFSGDGDPRNNLPGRPALDWFGAVPFYLGVALSVWSVLRRARRIADGAASGPDGEDDDLPGGTLCAPRRLISFFLLLSLLSLLLPTALSEYAPHFRRAIGAAAPVALLVGLGLSFAIDWLRSWILRMRPTGALVSRLAALVPVVVLVGGSAFATARDYFGRWAVSPDLYYAYDVGLWEIGEYVKELPSDEVVYISPRPTTDMTLAFAWREGRSTRHYDGRSAFVAKPGTAGWSGPATYVVIEHEDFRGSAVVRALYPQALPARRFLDDDGRVYAEAFRVEDASALARGPQMERLAAWDGFRLQGYDLDRSVYHAGETIYLQLWWSAEEAGSQDWTVFTHLLGPVRPDGGTVWAGHDGQPGQGSVPTSTWQAGELILDEHQLLLPVDIAAGVYSLEIGLYDGVTGVRAEADVSPRDHPDASLVLWDRADHVILGDLRLE